MKTLTVVAIDLSVMVITAAVSVGQAGPQQPNTDAGHAAVIANDARRDKSTPEVTVERYPRYELRADDTLDIRFEFTPEFNQTVTIQPDGYIALRGAGDVHVAGKTVPEVTELVRAMYATILQNPSISILLKDFEKPYVVVGGQVGRPGKYELRGDMTVTEAIAVAGGFNNAAKHSQVVLYRRISPDWYEAKLINVKKMLKTRDLREDTHLKPGDTLYVPQNTFSKIRQFVPNPGVGVGTNF
jgi:polysaccharide export outer membrane protein